METINGTIMNKLYDVVIIGAGPSGTVAASILVNTKLHLINMINLLEKQADLYHQIMAGVVINALLLM